MRSQAFDGIAEQKTGALIEAHDGLARGVGPGVKRQHGFEAGQVLPVYLPDAPLALAVGRERVFLRMAWAEPMDRARP